MNNFFEYNNVNGEVTLNGPDLLLIREFAKLMDLNRNKCKEDKTGTQHLRAFREFKYIYLAIHWQSPYADYDEQERHHEALKDAELTEEEWNNPEFREACRKFRDLQDSNKSIKLLKAARSMVDKLIDYFETADPLERDIETNKPIFKVKDIQTEMQNLIKVHDTMVQLEDQVKKQIEQQSSIRGGFTDGYLPNF